MKIFPINRSNWKRKFAVFKFTLSRGYVLCQLPALSIIGAGVIAPYFPEIKLAYLASIAFAVMVAAGWFDVHFNILHEEQRYMTEQNPTLMEGLFKNKEKEQHIMAQDIIDNLEVENEKENS